MLPASSTAVSILLHCASTYCIMMLIEQYHWLVTLRITVVVLWVSAMPTPCGHTHGPPQLPV